MYLVNNDIRNEEKIMKKAKTAKTAKTVEQDPPHIQTATQEMAPEPTVKATKVRATKA
jgi:hypothetical protein